MIECCQIPDTEYMAIVTNANMLYFYKNLTFKQSLQLSINESYLKEEEDKKSRNIMANTSNIA